MHQDEYRDSAEYLDILIRDAWKSLGPLLTDVTRRSAPVEGRVIDIGAGSGVSTEVVARALPSAEVLAVEPSPALRAVLLAKLAGDADLARRVTVIDSAVQSAPLPERFGMVVAMNMLGHLDPESRRNLWEMLADRLSPAGCAVVNLQAPTSVEAVPDTRFCSVTVGRRTYEGWGSAEPTGTDSVTWRMRYRTLEGSTVLSERAVEYRWWVLSEAQLREELREHGLRLHRVGEHPIALYAISAT